MTKRQDLLNSNSTLIQNIKLIHQQMMSIDLTEDLNWKQFEVLDAEHTNLICDLHNEVLAAYHGVTFNKMRLKYIKQFYVEAGL